MGWTLTRRKMPKAGFTTAAVGATGIGIASEDQAAVFEEFRQVGSDQARKGEVTGLGLAPVKRLEELCGGTIRLESEVGRGSTFTLPTRQEPTNAVSGRPS